LLNPWQQSALVQQWNFELPSMLWMLEPVLEQAHAAEISDSVRAAIAGLRQMASPALPSAQLQPVESQSVEFQPAEPIPIQPQTMQPTPIQQLNRQADMAAQLASFSTRMNSMTITQMHAMSGS
jgi:hypothetical protein